MIIAFLSLLQSILPSLAVSPGSFVSGGNTQISAMMLFVGNQDKVYILDKAEGNAATIGGHPAWGAVWDVNTHDVTLMDISTNTFCASGMHLPNGSWATFGGNGAVTVGGGTGSDPYPGNYAGIYDATYQDYDGRKSIRILNPCTDSDDFNSPNCQWFDNATLLSMQEDRWYSAAEPLGDGTIAIIGGFSTGGYINRNYPNDAPDGPATQNTYEFFPSNGQPATKMQFLINTSGLNAYAHTYLLASGKMLVQANYSTMIWNPQTNEEQDLPDMPNQIIRVYPGSGAVAMLPLTPANNYTQTVLFCGGQGNMSDVGWGDYAYPTVNTWEISASTDCQRLTPEPADGSPAAYEQDDDMLESRTMGQFVGLPDGTLLVINGGLNGTAGYSNVTNATNDAGTSNPFGFSLASGPVGTPAVYNPNAPKGSRWSNSGFGSSDIPRLYHSSAILLPDASVLVAGSNPNVDVNTAAMFPTEYRAEIFYPSYFSAGTRPQPSGIPSTLSYGGAPFDITVPASSYSGSANTAGDSVIVSVVRPGWVTHGMSMNMRFLQLNNTYTVNNDGSLTIHTSQMPPNSNIFQPGPAFVFVCINGIPSNGTSVIVGSGQVETQPTQAAGALPANVRLDNVSGSASPSSTGSNDNSSSGSNNNNNNSGSNKNGAVVRSATLSAVVCGLVAVMALLS